MSVRFGETVKDESARLESLGIDQNQIANILCKKDPQGYNYGIGVILDGKGKPLATSPTLLEYASRELQLSGEGTYKNASHLMDPLKREILKWQRIPEIYADNFSLALPSDAGTGAVQLSVEVALMLNSSLNTLGVEELGWPAYKAISKLARAGFKEYPINCVIEDPHVLPLYQAGPLNSTGFVQPEETVRERAKASARSNVPCVLDRAYSGFEWARLVDGASYDDIMKKSFEHQIEPFLEEGAFFFLAISPTKAFVCFSLRPCGFVLVFHPDRGKNKELENALNLAIRARGSSFQHPVSRAFATAFVEKRSQLEKEHRVSLKRVADSQKRWLDLTAGTSIKKYFEEDYAGLFRNFNCKPESAITIYNEHIYPVFSGSRLRLNITGIPDDDAMARKHVDLFAACCW